MRHLKKAAARLPFLWAQRYAFVLPGQKKARGPGRLRADGKIPSRGQFEGTGSVQVTIKAHRIPGIRNRLQRPRAKTVFLVFRSSGNFAGSENRVTARNATKRLSSPRPFRSAQQSLLGRRTPDSGCVNALWGKLPGMAVTKCIVLQEVESRWYRYPPCAPLLCKLRPHSPL